MQHIEYVRDAAHFNNELDRYANEKVTIQFVQDRGEEFVQVFPLLHPGDLFDLNYLVAMLSPEMVDCTIEDYFTAFFNMRERFYAIFESKYYSCYRSAYEIYESCRNEALLT